jgi:hypothetical protein
MKRCQVLVFSIPLGTLWCMSPYNVGTRMGELARPTSRFGTLSRGTYHARVGSYGSWPSRPTETVEAYEDEPRLEISDIETGGIVTLLSVEALCILAPPGGCANRHKLVFIYFTLGHVSYFSRDIF